MKKTNGFFTRDALKNSLTIQNLKTIIKSVRKFILKGEMYYVSENCRGYKQLTEYRHWSETCATSFEQSVRD